VDANPHSVANGEPKPNHLGHRNSDRNANCDVEEITYAHEDANSLANRILLIDAHLDRDEHADSCSHPFPNSNRDLHADPDPAPHTDAYPNRSGLSAVR
jgi:hypothetical protein